MKTGSRYSSWQTKINNEWKWIPWTCLPTSSESLPCSDNTEQQRAELHPQTNPNEAESLIKLACLSQQRQRCPLFGENIKTWSHVTQKTDAPRSHACSWRCFGQSHGRITNSLTSTTKGAVRSIRKFIKISNQIVFLQIPLHSSHASLYHLGHLLPVPPATAPPRGCLCTALINKPTLATAAILLTWLIRNVIQPHNQLKVRKRRETLPVEQKCR